MQIGSTEFKVGIFTAIAIATLALMAIILEGNPFKRSPQEFYTVLDNVGGIGQRTQVRVSGVQVGEVKKIEILPKGAKVNFDVSADVAIPKGSYIELRSRGILGDVYIEIVRNEDNKETLPEKSMIPKVSEFNDMNTLMASLTRIAKDVQTVTKTVAAVLGNDEGETSLRNILDNVESITEDTRDMVASEKENVKAFIANLKDVSDRFSGIMKRNTGNIEDVLKNVASASADFKVLTAELKEMVSGDNKGKLKTVVASLTDAMESIARTSGKVENIVGKVEKGEGTLGQLLTKDDTASELNNTLRDIQDFLRPATQLKLEVDYKGEYRTQLDDDLGRTGNHFNVRIRTRPDRYYLLGISDSPTSDTVTKTETNVSNDGQKQVTETREQQSENRGRLRFNAQFAKRFQAVGLRFGLFESFAGLAGDLYLFSDKLTGSVEVFDFNNSNSSATADSRGLARVKAYSNIYLTDNIYITGGADNLVKSKTPLPFIGAGLRFTDDDLRSVVGAAALSNSTK